MSTPFYVSGRIFFLAAAYSHRVHIIAIKAASRGLKEEKDNVARKRQNAALYALYIVSLRKMCNLRLLSQASAVAVVLSLEY